MAGGTGDLVSGTAYTNINQGDINGGGFVTSDVPDSVTSGGSGLVKIFFSNISDIDPQLGELADNGGSVWTHAIPSDSPAVDKGLYVRKAGSTYYYGMEDDKGVIVWYTEPDLSGTKVTSFPDGVEDLTATDATGYDLTDSPDLGAYEFRHE